METNTPSCTQELHDEIDQTPEEYRPLLLRIVHSFREGVCSTQAKRLVETQEALEDIKAGRLIDGVEVMNWLDTWGTDAEEAAPKL